jgi:hypothetical protein
MRRHAHESIPSGFYRLCVIIRFLAERCLGSRAQKRFQPQLLEQLSWLSPKINYFEGATFRSRTLQNIHQRPYTSAIDEVHGIHIDCDVFIRFSEQLKDLPHR